MTPASPPSPPPAGRWGRWLAAAAEYRHVAAVFLASRVLVLLVAVVGPLLLPPGQHAPGLATTTDLGAYWVRWDAAWYIDIAQHGYRFEGKLSDNIAFFPLFPMLVRAAGWLGADPATAGILIANACFLAGLCLLYRFVRDEFGESRTAELAVTLVAFGPASLWCAVGYTEALFLVLAVAFCWSLWARHLGWAAACGALAGLARSNAITLIAPAAVLAWPWVRQAWRERRIGRIVLAATAVAAPWAGYLAFAGYLQLTFGDWRAGQVASAAGWGLGIQLDPALMLTKLPGAGLKLFWAAHAFDEYSAWSWFIALAASVFALLALWEARARAWHFAYLLGFWAFFMVAYQYGGPLTSMARYTSVVFPIYTAAALFAARRPWAPAVLQAFAVAALTLTTLLFFAGYHIN